MTQQTHNVNYHNAMNILFQTYAKTIESVFSLFKCYAKYM